MHGGACGAFSVVHAVAVMEFASLSSSVLATLSAGEVVVVLAVWPHYEDGRVRARIERPAGWISMLSPQDGFRWAVRQQPGPIVMNGLLDGERVGLALSEALRVTRLADIRAADFGWCVGDQILEVNGVPVDSEDSFLAEVHHAGQHHRNTGKSVVFKIIRAPLPGHGAPPGDMMEEDFLDYSGSSIQLGHNSHPRM